MKQQFTDLNIWKGAHEFVVDVYKLILNFPKSEIYGLADQFKRASVSIPANIAEGFGRHSSKDFARFLYISLGSMEECHYYLILSRDLKYIQESEIAKLIDKLEVIKKQTLSFIHKIEMS